MDIFQIVNTYSPIWSEREIIVISVVLLLGIFCEIFLYWKGLIRLRQGIAGILLLIYLITVLGSTVFTRMPGERKYQLEIFWSWKEIIAPIGRTGASFPEDLVVENILNMILLFPVGVLLPIVWDRKVSWWKGLLFGITCSAGIELLQLVLCRGLFEFDDMIHNGVGCMVGTVIGDWILRVMKK